MISVQENQLIRLKFEDVLRMKRLRELCKFYMKGNCKKGNNCTFKHMNPEKSVVCKHWLRGLCKKNEQCEFLHEYNPNKMPECWFFAKYGECSNPECIFLHIRPEENVKDCPWFLRGFCQHGHSCKYSHAPQVACPDFLAGFCIKGPNCKFVHPSFSEPQMDDRLESRSKNFGGGVKSIPTFSSFSSGGGGGRGGDDTSTNLTRRTFNSRRPGFSRYKKFQKFNPINTNVGENGNHQFGGNRPRRPLSEVLCFKCRQTGHYANNCPMKGRGGYNPNFQEKGYHPAGYTYSQRNLTTMNQGNNNNNFM